MAIGLELQYAIFRATMKSQERGLEGPTQYDLLCALSETSRYARAFKDAGWSALHLQSRFRPALPKSADDWLRAAQVLASTNGHIARVSELAEAIFSDSGALADLASRNIDTSKLLDALRSSSTDRQFQNAKDELDATRWSVGAVNASGASRTFYFSTHEEALDYCKYLLVKNPEREESIQQYVRVIDGSDDDGELILYSLNPPPSQANVTS